MSRKAKESKSLPERLALKLFPEDAAARESFQTALLNPEMGEARAPCVLWSSGSAPELVAGNLEVAAPREDLNWLPPFVTRLAPGAEPGKLAGHQAGDFYSLDFSSVFAASVLLDVAADRNGEEGPRVLDLCAAPGGKSLFASLALGPSFLLANEVVGKRLGMLRHNLKRCGAANACTQRLDPAELAAAAPGAFDVVIVDAPCSGQSLLMKGIENPGCFHPATIKHNVRRQRRILANAGACVAPGGWMMYSTCTFAPEENERNVSWFLKQRPEFRVVEAPRLTPWRSALADDFPCYRLYPQDGLGAGAFTVLLKKEGNEASHPREERPALPEKLLAYPVSPEAAAEDD